LSMSLHVSLRFFGQNVLQDLAQAILMTGCLFGSILLVEQKESCGISVAIVSIESVKTCHLVARGCRKVNFRVTPSLFSMRWYLYLMGKVIVMQGLVGIERRLE
jgi:hypothetical protein